MRSKGCCDKVDRIMHRNIKVLLAASILLTSGVNLFAPLYAVYIKGIGGSLFHAGALAGLYLIFQGILFLVHGRFGESLLDRKKMIIGGYFLYALGYFLYIFVSNPLQIIGIQIILAIGEVIVTPSWSAIIADSLHKGKERAIYANFFGYRAIFQGVAAVFGGYFAIKLGFTSVFVIMTALSIAAGSISFLIRDNSAEKKTESALS